MICCNDSGVFSDNYFHMLPGQKRKVVFSPSKENKNNQIHQPKIELKQKKKFLYPGISSIFNK